MINNEALHEILLSARDIASSMTDDELLALVDDSPQYTASRMIDFAIDAEHDDDLEHPFESDLELSIDVLTRMLELRINLMN